MNIVIVSGHLSSEPTVRELQSGSVLVSYELTTRVDDAAVSVPLVWFDPAKLPALTAGDEVRAVGTVRRRFFRSGGATQSRTEVVVQSLGKCNDKRLKAAQRRLIADAMGADDPDGLRSI
jgi:single-strand DNA-binding protein